MMFLCFPIVFITFISDTKSISSWSVASSANCNETIKRTFTCFTITPKEPAHCTKEKHALHSRSTVMSHELPPYWIWKSEEVALLYTAKMHGVERLCLRSMLTGLTVSPKVAQTKRAVKSCLSQQLEILQRNLSYRTNTSTLLSKDWPCFKASYPLTDRVFHLLFHNNWT